MSALLTFVSFCFVFFFFYFIFLLLLLRPMSGLSIHAAEAMPLESASNRDAASDRDASMRQLEKINESLDTRVIHACSLVVLTFF